MLGQDEYGAETILNLGGTRFPVPDLAVGRLVETAAEATGMIDAYLGLHGAAVVAAMRSLVTGYDFLDGLVHRGRRPSSATAWARPPTTASSGTAGRPSQLRTKLHGPTHYDLVYLAGHFDANTMLAADFATHDQCQRAA